MAPTTKPIRIPPACDHEFTDRVKKRMKERDAWQGKAYRKADGYKNS